MCVLFKKNKTIHTLSNITFNLTIVAAIHSIVYFADFRIGSCKKPGFCFFSWTQPFYRRHQRKHYQRDSQSISVASQVDICAEELHSSVEARLGIQGDVSETANALCTALLGWTFQGESPWWDTLRSALATNQQTVKVHFTLSQSSMGLMFHWSLTTACSICHL
jgi:hypothetical protein